MSTPNIPQRPPKLARLVGGSILSLIGLWIFIASIIHGNAVGIVFGLILVAAGSPLIAIEVSILSSLHPRAPMARDEPIIEQFRIPVPENAPGPTKIESTSGRGTYTTDLSAQTCSCDRFRDWKRTRYQIGDMRRLCPHLCKLYCQTEAIQQVDELRRAMISNGFGIKTSIYILNITRDGEPDGQASFMWYKGDPWVDVFAKGKTGRIERFGFSFSDKRWSYGDPPPHLGRQLKAEIMNVLRQSGGVK